MQGWGSHCGAERLQSEEHLLAPQGAFVFRSEERVAEDIRHGYGQPAVDNQPDNAPKSRIALLDNAPT